MKRNEPATTNRNEPPKKREKTDAEKLIMSKCMDQIARFLSYKDYKIVWGHKVAMKIILIEFREWAEKNLSAQERDDTNEENKNFRQPGFQQHLQNFMYYTIRQTLMKDKTPMERPHADFEPSPETHAMIKSAIRIHGHIDNNWFREGDFILHLSKETSKVNHSYQFKPFKSVKSIVRNIATSTPLLNLQTYIPADGDITFIFTAPNRLNGFKFKGTRAHLLTHFRQHLTEPDLEIHNDIEFTTTVHKVHQTPEEIEKYNGYMRDLNRNIRLVTPHGRIFDGLPATVLEELKDHYEKQEIMKREEEQRRKEREDREFQAQKLKMEATIVTLPLKEEMEFFKDKYYKQIPQTPRNHCRNLWEHGTCKFSNCKWEHSQIRPNHPDYENLNKDLQIRISLNEQRRKEQEQMKREEQERQRKEREAREFEIKQQQMEKMREQRSKYEEEQRKQNEKKQKEVQQRREEAELALKDIQEYTEKRSLTKKSQMKKKSGTNKNTTPTIDIPPLKIWDLKVVGKYETTPPTFESDDLKKFEKIIKSPNKAKNQDFLFWIWFRHVHHKSKTLNDLKKMQFVKSGLVNEDSIPLEVLNELKGEPDE